eukprot:gb/GEZN01012170.1/.p1 GENE.gb/GEZN01012170.1/~~gb/GEZN01012170.1/.p1  ORF type:complete len:348 (+),score=62.55 gb/GEZN01012170.1/:41-1084(+)
MYSMPPRRSAAPQGSVMSTALHRLFFGQIPDGLTEGQLVEQIERFGHKVESAFFRGEKGFAFVTMKTPEGASKLLALPQGGFRLKGQPIHIRPAAHKATLWVGDLSPYITNDMLQDVFTEKFGPVERARVVCDERGFSLCHGFIEFEKKSSLDRALHECRKHPLLLGRFPKPINVRPYIYREMLTGHTEAMVRHSPARMAELAAPPRFPPPGTMDFQMASEWRALQQEEEKEKEALKKDQLERRLGLDEKTRNMLRQQQEQEREAEARRRQEEEMAHAAALRRQAEELARRAEFMRIEAEQQRRQSGMQDSRHELFRQAVQEGEPLETANCAPSVFFWVNAAQASSR